MIKVIINYHNNNINDFKITGHADAGEYGKDIVCAAVSALSITTINGIDKVAKVHPNVKSDDENGGFLMMILPKILNHDQEIQVQTLLKSFENGISDITKNYTRYVDLNINKN